MAKDKATPVSAEEVTLDPDLLEILQGLTKVSFPPMAIDPITAGLNFGTMAMFLVIVIINTVPAEQHAENWKRVSELIDKLRPGQ
jgi:hypothetical protein